MTDTLTPEPVTANGREQQSLTTAAARTLAKTTKTPPQMQAITQRWLLRRLPWVQVAGGTYRVNRRLSYAVGGGQVSFDDPGGAGGARIIPPSLCEIPQLAGFDDDELLEALSDRFVPQDYEAGTIIAEAGRPLDRLVVVVRGKVRRIGTGHYGEPSQLGVEADGDYFGDEALAAVDPAAAWGYTAQATTRCSLLVLPLRSFRTIVARAPALQRQLRSYEAAVTQPQNKKGEADITLASGHRGEPFIPSAFADYETSPREHGLSVAQAVLRVHTRVGDLFNEPMDQVGAQLKLTVEALRERQEHELVNNPDFGLLHNVDRSQRIQTRTGPPTPHDLDDLLSRRRSTRLFLAHPQAIAAFGRECTRRRIYPTPLEIDGTPVAAWRDVPILPCDKIPVTEERTSTILAMRTGEDVQGVVGLWQTGIPHEHEPGLNVRFMGIDERAIVSYLVSAYYSAAVLVPNALGALENVEVAHPGS